MAANQVMRHKPAQKAGVEKQDDLITIGFRVKPKEKAVIQGYVNRTYNQFVVDPNTKEPKNVELSL
jgi:hypothetical protein